MGTDGRDPCLHEPSKADRLRLDKRKINHILVRKQYWDGRMAITAYGSQMGTWVSWHGSRKRADPILLVGPLQIGITRYWAGVSPGLTLIFLGKGGKLWRVPRKPLPGKASDPRRLDAGGKRMWADTYEQLILDKLCPAEEIAASKHTCWRYRQAVKSLVAARVTESVGFGYDRTDDDFAKGACESWTRHDLIHPRVPTIQHALYVSLVLSLPVEQASELVEMAALMEYRVPIMTRHLAGALYQEACQRLALLCPAWYSEGWSLDWKHVGSIDRYFRREFARLITDAMVRDQDLGSASGKLRTALPE